MSKTVVNKSLMINKSIVVLLEMKKNLLDIRRWMKKDTKDRKRSIKILKHNNLKMKILLDKERL